MSSNNGGGREAMAMLAARLMVSNAAPPSQQPASFTPSPPSTAPADTIPRSMNASQAAASPTLAQPPANPLGNSSSPTSTRSPAPVMDGPSLRGSEEQLKEARALQASMTQGGGKSRGGSRTRVLSQAPPAAPPRTAYAPPMSSPRPRPSTSGVTTAPVGGTTSGLSQWQALRGPAAAPTASTLQRKDSVVESAAAGSAAPTANKHLAGQQPLPKFDESLKQTTTTVKAGGASASTTAGNTAGVSQPWQLKEITNTLHDRATDARPHLRPKSLIKPETSAPTASQQAKSNEAAMNATTPDGKSVQAAEMAHIKVETPVVAAQQREQDAAAADSGKDSGSDAFEALKKEVVVLAGRVASLEHENFDLVRQMEAVLQAEERRKFLGTDAAKIPFGLDVKDPKGNVIRVQATPGLKVGELIRRIRAKANVPPSASMNPRVSYDDVQLGHGMTLGEAGIGEGSVVLFTFSA